MERGGGGEEVGERGREGGGEWRGAEREEVDERVEGSGE